MVIGPEGPIASDGRGRRSGDSGGHQLSYGPSWVGPRYFRPWRLTMRRPLGQHRSNRRLPSRGQLSFGQAIWPPILIVGIGLIVEGVREVNSGRAADRWPGALMIAVGAVALCLAYIFYLKPPRN